MEAITIIKAQFKSSGTDAYIGKEKSGPRAYNVLVDNVSSASCFTIDDVVGIAKGIASMRHSDSVINHTIKVMLYVSPNENTENAQQELNNTLEIIALRTLSMSEIEALGLTERAIFHKLGDNL